MTKFILLSLGIVLAGCAERSQPGESKNSDIIAKPKLVVGIVVDQMRHEYLYRYYAKFGEDGFKRLMRDGFINKNTHYNYIPTKTAPGHASIYTGATPAVHGIIGNSWYDRRLKREIENVEDTILQVYSPRNMLTTTITDELRISSQFRSKVVGVSIKDRGAILPAGHIPTGAYWYEEETGAFVSSTYYKNSSPGWLNDFNKKNYADSLLSLTWNTLLPIDQYTESGPDDTAYETIFDGNDKPVFPYNLAELRDKKARLTKGSFGPKVSKGYKLLPTTPFGNTITTEIALAALHGENLGRGEATDFLAISYSSTDKVGHAFGPQSVEVEDTYLRLDLELARLLKALDSEVGAGNYLIFLTADHGVGEVPNYLSDVQIPAGLIDEDRLKANLNTMLSKTFGGGVLVYYVGNEQVFLNTELIHAKKMNLTVIQQKVAEYLKQINGISVAYPAGTLSSTGYSEGVEVLLQRGYHYKRSGDVLMVYEPGWIAHDPVGTSHGSGYTYDTHVPLVWYGWGISPGVSNRYQAITDIAPTLSGLLNIKFPNGATGHPILEVVGK